MIRWLIGLLGGAAKRRLRNYLLGIGAVAASTLLAAASLGFGTFAAYVYLRASQGPVTAALIVCAAYGLLAITSLAILAIGVARRRAGLLRRATAASAPPSPGNFDSLLQSLAAAGATQDQLALVAAMRRGRELSPMQLLAVALVGGFIAGRKLGK